MVKLTNLRLRGNNLTTQYLRLGYTAPTPAPAPGPGPGPSPEPEPEPLIPGLEGIVGIWNAYGLTNEEMKANPVWKDLSGNGNDIELKNFAWALDDGVGKYLYNFASGNWFAYNSLVDAKLESTRITLKGGGGDPAPAQFTSVIRRKDFGLQGVKFTGKVIITGLDSAGGEPFYFGKFDEPANTSVLLHEGLNDIDFTIPSFWTWYGFGFRKIIDNVDITIQLIPYAYENALVFDGVDDYGINLDFPVFSKEKGYTVMALRKYIIKNSNSILITKALHDPYIWSSGEFAVEFNLADDGQSNNYSFGGYSRHNPCPTLITYQITNEYSGTRIPSGGGTTYDYIMSIGAIKQRDKAASNFANLALYSLVILDHDSTQEERALIKNYWMKYYADMIEYDEFDPSKPSYAWTVKGKTNEDLDRATVKELRGSTSLLKLENFGYTQQSGYNADGYLVTDGVDDNILTSTTIYFDDTWTIIFDLKTIYYNDNSIQFAFGSLGVFLGELTREGLKVGIKNSDSSGGTLLNNIFSIKALRSDGTIYDENWNEIKIEELGYKGSSNVVSFGLFLYRYFSKIKFKSCSVYKYEILTKPQCQKAYDWLQEQVAPKTGIPIEGAPNGVYILGTDKMLYTNNKWNTAWNNNVVGVAVIYYGTKFVIAPTDSPSRLKWGENGLISTIIETKDVDTAKGDYRGLLNTNDILTKYPENSPAANFCIGQTFKNGQKGYLGALGEWYIAAINKTDIDTCMANIGGTPLSSHYWSSTQYDYSNCWVIQLANTIPIGNDRMLVNSVRAFAPLT